MVLGVLKLEMFDCQIQCCGLTGSVNLYHVFTRCVYTNMIMVHTTEAHTNNSIKYSFFILNLNLNSLSSKPHHDLGAIHNCQHFHKCTNRTLGGRG